LVGKAAMDGDAEVELVDVRPNGIELPKVWETKYLICDILW